MGMDCCNSEHKMKNLTGLILAAGYSSRMGAFKPLLQIGDGTAVERIAETLKSAGIETIVGVSGFRSELLTPIFAEYEIIEAYNKDFDQGMFTSIQTGIRKALVEFPETEGFLLMLVDCPLIPAEVLALIAEKRLEAPDAFILPTYHGKNGHPLFIPVVYAEEILSYEGEGGLKAIRNRHEDQMIRLEVEQEAVVMDMDTPEGYQEILDYFRRQENEDLKNKGLENKNLEKKDIEVNLENQLQGKRIFFVRHGEIEQHKEKIFLGQTDVALSEKGKEQALAAAKELEQHGISVSHIYTSDLSRAAETAEIIKKQLTSSTESLSTELEQTNSSTDARTIELILEPKLREMALGAWDGEYISEIQKKYPDEYKKRGEHILSYKYGNDSENFYDLQYRAMKGFQSILDRERAERDECKDILIVAHQGVINVIQSSLNHEGLIEGIRKPIPNGGIRIMDYR